MTSGLVLAHSGSNPVSAVVRDGPARLGGDLTGWRPMVYTAFQLPLLPEAAEATFYVGTTTLYSVLVLLRILRVRITS